MVSRYPSFSASDVRLILTSNDNLPRAHDLSAGYVQKLSRIEGFQELSDFLCFLEHACNLLFGDLSGSEQVLLGILKGIVIMIV